MNNLIMTNRKNKIFIKRIINWKSHKVMVVATINGIFFDIPQCVIHPSHIPFIPKPQSTDVNRQRDIGKGSRLLGYCHDPIDLTVNGCIHFFNEVDGFIVFTTTITIRYPLTWFTRNNLGRAWKRRHPLADRLDGILLTNK